MSDKVRYFTIYYGDRALFQVRGSDGAFDNMGQSALRDLNFGSGEPVFSYRTDKGPKAGTGYGFRLKYRYMGHRPFVYGWCEDEKAARLAASLMVRRDAITEVDVYDEYRRMVTARQG